MAKRGDGFTLELDTLTPGIARMTPELRKAVRAIIYRYTPLVERHAKTTAPWTDRTSLARAGLGAVSDATRSDVYGITLYHTVSYGIWLEVRWSGKYAVIQPTIETMGPEVMLGLERLLDRIY